MKQVLELSPEREAGWLGKRWEGDVSLHTRSCTFYIMNHVFLDLEAEVCREIEQNSTNKAAALAAAESGPMGRESTSAGQ